jgi:23S rRNA (cytosine1962-C5)-methyltransferase
MSMFANRLRKNAKTLRKWAAAQGLTAFRLYDLDIPEYPFAVDRYGEYVHVLEYPRRRSLSDGSAERKREEVLAAVVEVLGVEGSNVFTKTHEPKPWGQEQYERQGRSSTTTTVVESGLRFEVNLSDYLDTGLFMDHRDTRARVRGEVSGKRFLNLFAYTGAFTVYALAGGAARTTTVDLSPHYLEWAKRNFALNGFATGREHELVRADALEWVGHTRGQYDVIVLDPPSFSVSKRMEKRFEVQRHHHRLIERVQGLLAPGGSLYFSTNYLSFELDAALQPVEELTPGSIPKDFRREIHRCWRFSG